MPPDSGSSHPVNLGYMAGSNQPSLDTALVCKLFLCVVDEASALLGWSMLGTIPFVLKLKTYSLSCYLGTLAFG